MQGNWLSTSLPKNKYRYNGVEQTNNLGLDVYIGWGILTYDIGRTVYNSQTIYNSIINE